MIVRTILSGIMVLFLGFLKMVYEPYRAAVAAQMSVSQLNADDPITYGLGRAAATSDIPTTVISWLVLALLALVWLTALPSLVKYLKSIGAAALLFLMIPLLAACGPYQKEVFEEIAPNETAFMIPLEGASKSGQELFMSIDYLNQNKVAAKRVSIPTRKLQKGYMGDDYEWIPTVRIVKVDRTPIVREWTRATETGTSSSNQAFKVESIESIDFWVGGVASGSIREEDAARFLYYFPAKSLAQVMDSNVRNMLQKVLFDEFGTRNLAAGQRDKKAIFAHAEESVRTHFDQLGLTIDYIGGSEGLTYTDEKVQAAINKNFETQQEQVRAQAEYDAQSKRNQLAVEKAQADATVRTEQGRGEAEYLRLRGEQLARYPQLVELIQAERWQGNVPDTVITGEGSVPGIFLSPRSNTPKQR